MIFDQSEFTLRCEWGERGVAALAPISDVVIIVDVLSFSTAVDIATNRGATVFPYCWRDQSTADYAQSVQAQLATRRGELGYSLSPASLLAIPAKTKLVLPSPNGATLTLSTGDTPTLAGCLRNCDAIARAARHYGTRIAVIPAGERWHDGSLRPAWEDFIGAGAILSHLEGSLSPEAQAAVAAFERGQKSLAETLRQCSSGKELVAQGFTEDIELAAAFNVSACIPTLVHRAYVNSSH